MEKPLSHNLKKIEILEKLVKKNKLIFMMAKCYRFHEGFLKVDEIIKNNLLGKIYNVEMCG